jgi:hypothetical protein
VATRERWRASPSCKPQTSNAARATAGIPPPFMQVEDAKRIVRLTPTQTGYEAGPEPTVPVLPPRSRAGQAALVVRSLPAY